MASYNIHPTVSEVNTKQGSALSNLFAGVDIFQSDLQVTGADLLNQFLLDYGERAFMLPATAAEMAADYSGYATRVVQAFQLKYKTQLKYKYTKLLETMFYNYNPIWNVDGTETTTEEKNQNTVHNITTNVSRQQTQTVSTANNQTQTISGTTSGSVSSTDTEDTTNSTAHGETVTTTEKPGSTITHSVAPYDSTDTTTATTDTAGGENKTTEAHSGTDTTTIDTDRTTSKTESGSNSQTTTYSGQPDTVTTTYSGNPDVTTVVDSEQHSGDPDERITIRQGNIGVTSTQSLIQQEREIVDFDIIGNFLHDCSNLICLNVYIDTLES